MEKVTILMSTYNGSKYIKEQLDSLIEQTYSNIDILIRDDGSKDNTMEILKEYEQNNANITVYQGENFGPAKSFMDLVKKVLDSDFYAFCDQDDVWKSEKIEKAIEKIKEVDENNLPILYFSNTQLVDKDLNNLENVKKIKEQKINLGNALIENIATGCTVVFNKKLLELLQKIEYKDMKPGYLHDNLAYRIAFSTGKVIYDKESYILYRQHGNNVVGNSSSMKDKINKRKKSISTSINLRSNMSKYILEHYDKEIREENRNTIKKIAYCNNCFINKVKLSFDFKIKRMNPIDDILYRIAILLGKI